MEAFLRSKGSLCHSSTMWEARFNAAAAASAVLRYMLSALSGDHMHPNILAFVVDCTHMEVVRVLKILVHTCSAIKDADQSKIVLTEAIISITDFPPGSVRTCQPRVAAATLWTLSSSNSSKLARC